MTTEAAPGTADAPRPDPFDPDRHPRRINLGCGFDVRPGYLNVDLHAFHHPDLVADVRDLSMLPSGVYEEILAQDVLEHLPRTDAPRALAEWARLLRPGGVLVLRVPDLIGLLGLFVERGTLGEQEQIVQCLFGTQAYDGDFHQNGFTELLLRHRLHEAGFADAEFSHMDGWIFNVVARRAAEPGPLVLGDLPFMRTSAAPGAVAPDPRPPTQDMADVAAHIRQAEEHADLGLPLPSTRLRFLKRAVVRAARVVTHHQVAHNRAVDAALRGLLERAHPPPE
jgi:predicted SAM-dependent methyltransferase